MNLLITGGAGFIGSNLIHYLLSQHQDWQIVNLDKLTYAGNRKNLSDLEFDPRYTFIQGDIADRPLLNSLLAHHHFDAVLNLAAESHVDRSILDPSPFIDTNTRGAQILMEAARQVGVPKFIQVSTDEVYGALTPGKPPLNEQAPLAPNNPYAASKASADLMACSYYKTFNFPVIITRSTNNYGPYQYPEKLIPLFITNALEDLKLPIYGDGQQVRDWLHVKDHCRALELALLKGRPGEIYNISANCELTNLVVAHAMLKILGKSDKLISHVENRLAHDVRYALNSNKICSELGWHPQHHLLEDLPELISWYKENVTWWQRLKGAMPR